MAGPAAVGVLADGGRGRLLNRTAAVSSSGVRWLDAAGGLRVPIIETERRMEWDEAMQPTGRRVTLGEPLHTLSMAELEARVAALQAEIARVEAELARKRSRAAEADALFRSPE